MNCINVGWIMNSELAQSSRSSECRNDIVKSGDELNVEMNGERLRS
jgi:hypothetical protein